MTESGSRAATPTHAALNVPRAKQLPARFRLLAVVDGTERTNRVLDYIVTLAQGRDAIEVVVINVQTMREDGRLRGYQSFKQEEVHDRLINDLGAPIVGSAGRWLNKAQIPHRSQVLIGDPVQTIVRCAAEEDCDSIVIGERPPKDMMGWISATLGLSPVLRLLAAANIPVVVVK
jgi:nucleotide-binding universal stress UspA family protein